MNFNHCQAFAFYGLLSLSKQIFYGEGYIIRKRGIVLYD